MTKINELATKFLYFVAKLHLNVFFFILRLAVSEVL